MIGIYKIVNKINQKIYVGQSIHCGKRLDEHCRGKQFIDEVIQVDGVENFSFEILKSVEQDELSYWEDYFIMKFDCKYPNGYNKRWNTNEETRKEIQKRLDEELQIEENEKTYICFPSNDKILKEMAYGDSIYAWLLLHSHYDECENHNYIYKNEFTFIQIARDIHRTRQCVSKRFNELLKTNGNDNRDLIWWSEHNKCYILPCFREFEKLDADTVLNLFWLCGKGNKSRKEELVKTYAWLKKRVKNGCKYTSYEDFLNAFGHTKGNEETYDRYKDILTTLQGAGLIKFRTDIGNKIDGKFGKTFYVYQVNNKASQEWVDKKNQTENQ